MIPFEKIHALEKAILYADHFKSENGEFTYGVPGLTSLKIRHLLNNIGAMGTNLLSIGIHKGATHSALIHGNKNLKEITAIDNFCEEFGGNTSSAIEKEARENISRFLPMGCQHRLIVEDCFSVDLVKIPNGVDVYEYDGWHGAIEQEKALTHFNDIFADEFIYLCDDWNFPAVQEGTRKGLENYEVIREYILLTDGEPNQSWHNSYAVFLLRKK